MIATLPYVKSKFDEFNQLIFHNELPPLPIRLSSARSALGRLRYRYKKNLFGKVEYYDFRMFISKMYDLEECVLEDTIIHEMIHYYIVVNNLKDRSSHGPLFRQIMKDINELHGRHITISYRSKPKTE